MAKDKEKCQYIGHASYTDSRNKFMSLQQKQAPNDGRLQNGINNDHIKDNMGSSNT